MIAQGEIWWADLPEPQGSELGYRLPVLVIQGDSFNRSALRTVVCVALTGNVRWAEAAGNVLLPSGTTGLPRDAVANVSQILTVDRTVLTERVGMVPESSLALVLTGIDVMLGR